MPLITLLYSHKIGDQLFSNYAGIIHAILQWCYHSIPFSGLFMAPEIVISWHQNFMD